MLGVPELIVDPVGTEVAKVEVELIKDGGLLGLLLEIGLEVVGRPVEDFGAILVMRYFFAAGERGVEEAPLGMEDCNSAVLRIKSSTMGKLVAVEGAERRAYIIMDSSLLLAADEVGWAEETAPGVSELVDINVLVLAREANEVKIPITSFC